MSSVNASVCSIIHCSCNIVIHILFMFHFNKSVCQCHSLRQGTKSFLWWAECDGCYDSICTQEGHITTLTTQWRDSDSLDKNYPSLITVKLGHMQCDTVWHNVTVCDACQCVCNVLWQQCQCQVSPEHDQSWSRVHLPVPGHSSLVTLASGATSYHINDHVTLHFFTSRIYSHRPNCHQWLSVIMVKIGQ